MLRIQYDTRHQTPSVYIECLCVYIAVTLSCRCRDDVAQCLCRLPCFIVKVWTQTTMVSKFLSSFNISSCILNFRAGSHLSYVGSVYPYVKGGSSDYTNRFPTGANSFIFHALPLESQINKRTPDKWKLAH
jgi:hypothetical protein